MMVLNVSFLGLFLLYVWAIWRVHNVYHEHEKSKERQNVVTAKYTGWVELLFPGLCYLWAGPEILRKNFKPGVPVAIRTPETSYVHFSSDEHIRELRDAAEEQLSLHALSKDMFMPKYTMSGLEVHGSTSVNGSVHMRALRVSLRSHLSDFVSPLSRILAAALADELGNGKKQQNGWTRLPSFDMAKKVITAANALVFFGTDLSADHSFLEAALAYPEDMFFAAELLRLTPTFTHPIIGPLLMRKHRSKKNMIDYLMPVIEERIHEAKCGGESSDSRNPKRVDCIQFFIDANSRQGWPAKKIAQVLLGVWFASVHQPALTLVYALEDLCEHPEYIEPLRQEVASLSSRHMREDGPVPESLDNLHLLDAFLKESSRTHPSDSISVRRKVLQPFTFRDGTSLVPGDVACVPLQAILQDEAKYPDSTAFSAWRFMGQDARNVTERGVQNPSRFTDTDFSFPLWGLGTHTCPGRFYASLVLKLVLAHVFTHYDFDLGAQSGSRKILIPIRDCTQTGGVLTFSETDND